MPAGRPSDYTPELAEQCAQVYEAASISLIAAFNARDDLPCFNTVLRWEEQHEDFRERLNRARKKRSRALAESALDIADFTADDTVIRTGRDGQEYEQPNHEWINRSRLRFEARRWAARTLDPQTYGERTVHAVDAESATTLADLLRKVRS